MIKELLKKYPWYDHPEGLKFVETHRDDYRTSGHWLMLPAAMSAFHRVLNNDEIWIIQKGSLLLHYFDDKGKLVSKTLGLNIATGEEPLVAVPKGNWQAAELAANCDFAFGTVICAPAFEFNQFEIADRAQLIKQFPNFEPIIMRLTLR